jgi:hypothetical protein
MRSLGVIRLEIPWLSAIWCVSLIKDPEMMPFSAKDLRDAAISALTDRECAPRPCTGPGRPHGSVLTVTVDGVDAYCSVKTGKIRQIAFALKGEGWATLDDVDYVVIAVPAAGAPAEAADVYFLGAEIVREYFSAHRKAREAAGHKLTDGYGMWVPVDPVDGVVGTGVIQHALWHHRVGEVSAHLDTELVSVEPGTTVAELLRDAAERLAQVTGLPVEAIRISARIELPASGSI